MRRRTGLEVAAIEAMEEAGIAGRIRARPLGHYCYSKVFDDCVLPVRVAVFPLRVKEEFSEWREADDRRRIWLSRSEACAVVAEAGLARLFSRI